MVTGAVERGVIKVGEEIEIVGIRPTVKTTCTGVEMFRKLLDQGQAGDNVGLLLRGTKREEVERGPVQASFELGGDPRARQVEEAHIVCRCTQFVPEPCRGLGAGIELGQVEDGKREISHASSVNRSRGARSSVASHYSRRFEHVNEATTIW